MTRVPASLRSGSHSAALLALASLALVGGLTAFGFGVACFATGAGGAGCAVLIVVVPGLAIPFAVAAGITGAALRGWLVASADVGEPLSEPGPGAERRKGRLPRSERP